MTPKDEITRVLATYNVPPVTTPEGACCRNVLAKLATVPQPLPLISHVRSVKACLVERIYVEVDTDFQSSLQADVVGDDAFACEGRPRSSVHQGLLMWLALTHPTEHFALLSYRERVTFNSLQCVVALNTQPGFDYVDCDIDLGGALTDVVGFVRHEAELVKGGVTDHLALRERFLQDPVYRELI